MVKEERYQTIVTFSQADFDAFAALSGDDNPIHVDPDFAARSKFGRTVAHGMFLFGHVRAALWAMAPDAVPVQQQMIFPNPTFADEPVTIDLAATVVRDDGLIELSTTVTRPDGKPGLVGTALVAQRPLSPDDVAQLAKSKPAPASEVDSFHGLAVGQRAEKTAVFDVDIVAVYRQLTGDLLGGDNAVPGGLLGGMISDLLGTQLPGRGTNWLKQHFAFLQSAQVGERVTAVVQVSRIRPAKALINLLTTCVNQSGAPVCTGEALVLVNELEKLQEVSMT